MNAEDEPSNPALSPGHRGAQESGSGLDRKLEPDNNHAMLSILAAIVLVAVLALLFSQMVRHIGGAEIAFSESFAVLLVARMMSSGARSLASPFGTLEASVIAFTVYVVGMAVYLSYRHGIPVWRGMGIGIVFVIASFFGMALLVSTGVFSSPASSTSPAPTP